MQDLIQAPPGTTRQAGAARTCWLGYLWSGREKKKMEIGMARKRAENREGSLGFPGFVKPVFTKDSKPLGRRKRSLGHLGSGNPYSPKEGEPPEGNISLGVVFAISYILS
ncbi:hypothetical protein TNCV_5011621 [Trichonephila clavipes]|nr:hypothetical protein TNCV_5011621 [Trichonephila clavipes]